MVSEKLPDRTKEDNEVQANSKEDKTKEFDSEENRSDGNEHEHEKQASNQEGQQKFPYFCNLIVCSTSKLHSI